MTIIIKVAFFGLVNEGYRYVQCFEVFLILELQVKLQYVENAPVKTLKLDFNTNQAGPKKSKALNIYNISCRAWNINLSMPRQKLETRVLRRGAVLWICLLCCIL